MKKIILLITLAILSFNSIKANETKIISDPYIQTQITKTFFPNLINLHTNWYKNDSTKVIFDFINNNKIIINADNYNIVYKVKKKLVTKYENAEQYNMVGFDLNNNRCDIQVIYYKDNNILMTISNDTSIVRYKFLKNS